LIVAIYKAELQRARVCIFFPQNFVSLPLLALDAVVLHGG